MQQLRQLLGPAVFEGDEEKTRIGRIQNVILWFVLVDILLATLLLLLFPVGIISPLLFNLPLFLIVAYLLVMVRRGRVKTAGYGILVVGTLYAFAASFVNGGVRSPVTATFFLLVLLAGAMFGRRGLFQMLAVNISMLIMLLAAELSDVLPAALFPPSAVSAWIVYVSVLAASAVLVYLNTNGLEIALIRAREGEAHSNEQVRWLSSLRAIDVAIANNEDVHQTLSIILDQVFLGLKPDAAEILRFDSKSRLLHRLDGRGFHNTAVLDVPQSADQGCVGKAVRSMFPDGCAEANPEDLPVSYRNEGFTAWYAAPLVVKNDIRGLVQVFFRRRYPASEEWINQFETLAGQAAITIENAELVGDLRRANEDLQNAYQVTLEGWIDMLDRRDHETEQHTRRVTELCLRLGRLTGLGAEELVQMQRGAWLHDIGKIGISDSIFKKEEPLTAAEQAEIRQHPLFAYDKLARIDFLAPSLDIPYCHHERWDGLGYPRGLKGAEIPLQARIFSLADVYDALTSERDYRNPKAWPREQAFDYIREMAGKQFDPNIAAIFLSHPEIVEKL